MLETGRRGKESKREREKVSKCQSDRVGTCIGTFH